MEDENEEKGENDNDSFEDDSDFEDDDFGVDDPALQAFRKRRLAEMKREHAIRMEQHQM